ncbi:MAG: glycosyltransferase [Candidatus Gottesmanbacteria bacterium]|nr:glycosyltransferase [Candidatus Gottesmanbacteria bacterium]
MRIGILTPSIYMDATRYKDRIFAPGDLARALVAGLVKKGHDVTWFSAPENPRGSTLVPGDRTLLERDLRIRVFQDISPEIQDKMSLYGTKMYYELDLVARAYREAKEKKLDCIHNFHSFGYFAHFFQEITHVPTLYTLHDPIPTENMLERWLFDQFPTHQYISISNSQRGQLGDHFIDTVYNGIDPTKFPFDATGGNGLIAVGRMVAVKGHDIAIQAARAARVPLSFATWMSDSVKNSSFYKEKIEPFVDGKDIKVNSLMQGADLISAYQHAKALLFPIQWEEPFGLVMIEAMSCGTPVIAFNRGSVAEIVKDGVTGFVVDPSKGVEGLVEAIKRIGEIDRAACRKHVEEKFTIEKMVEGYENVYKKVLGKK